MSSPPPVALPAWHRLAWHMNTHKGSNRALRLCNVCWFKTFGILKDKVWVFSVWVGVYTTNRMKEWHALPTPRPGTHENANGIRISALAKETSLLEISKYPTTPFHSICFHFPCCMHFLERHIHFLLPSAPDLPLLFALCLSSRAKSCTLQWEGKQGGAFLFLFFSSLLKWMFVFFFLFFFSG